MQSTIILYGSSDDNLQIRGDRNYTFNSVTNETGCRVVVSISCEERKETLIVNAVYSNDGKWLVKTITDVPENWEVIESGTSPVKHSNMLQITAPGLLVIQQIVLNK